jgi:hypothetical protein
LYSVLHEGFSERLCGVFSGWIKPVSQATQALSPAESVAAPRARAFAHLQLTQPTRPL